jgi:predicted Zn-dependent protease
MILQIHESVGHPLEFDRILGDERNYAGTSFVTPDMFGSYQYGSDLLNITFDPSRAEEFASYAFDDDGQPARREYLICNGILLAVSAVSPPKCAWDSKESLTPAPPAGTARPSTVWQT